MRTHFNGVCLLCRAPPAAASPLPDVLHLRLHSLTHQSVLAARLRCLQAPSLSVTKTADPNTINTGSGGFGEQVTFSISATNAGPGVAKDVVLTDTLVNANQLGMTTTQSRDVTCTPGGTVLATLECASDQDSRTCTWSLGDLAPGTTCTVHPRVSDATSAGTIHNTATVTAANLPSGCQTCEAEATVTVQASPFFHTPALLLDQCLCCALACVCVACA